MIADLRQPTGIGEATLQSAGSAGESSSEMGLSLDLCDDPDTLLRCLAVSCELLRELEMKQRRLSPILETLTDSLVREEWREGEKGKEERSEDLNLLEWERGQGSDMEGGRREGGWREKRNFERCMRVFSVRDTVYVQCMYQKGRLQRVDSCIA